MGIYQILLCILSGLLLLLGGLFYRYVKRTKKAFAKQKKELSQVSTTNQRLFSLLEQEMRKPILVFRDISKKVNFLIAQQEFETLKKLGHQLDKEAIAVNLLLENLLVWSKNQKDTYPFQPQPIPVKQIIQEINQTFLPLSQEKSIHFVSDFSESAYANADVDTLMLVLKNIIYHIIQSTPIDEQINLLITPDPKGVNISISGLGIDTNLQRLFDEEAVASTDNQSLFDAPFIKELIQLNRGTYHFIPALTKNLQPALQLKLSIVETVHPSLQLSFPRA